MTSVVDAGVTSSLWCRHDNIPINIDAERKDMYLNNFDNDRTHLKDGKLCVHIHFFILHMNNVVFIYFGKGCRYINNCYIIHELYIVEKKMIL